MTDPGPGTGSDPGTPGPLPSPPSFLDRWFAGVRVPRDAPATLGALAARGSVILVLRSSGIVELLYARWFLRHLGLPPLRAAAGCGALLARLLGLRRSAAGLLKIVAAGDSAVISLGSRVDPRPFDRLLAFHRQGGRRVFLVPALLTWSRRTPRLEPSVWDLLLGSPAAPNTLANLVGFLRNFRRTNFDLGEPVEVGPFAASHAGVAPSSLATRLRARLRLRLAREHRAAVGPPLKAPSRVRNKVLRDRSLQAVVDRVAAETGRPRRKVLAEAARDLGELASRYRPALIELARPVLKWAFGRLYDAVEVDEEGFARLRRAAARAPVVLCPSHKSYVDFLVLSWIMVERGMTAPHIAAGINLSFWPFGAIARMGGAFFIRRKVKGDRIYTAVLRAYVKHLLRDGFPQEFYVEGGRSRTGRLLPPKTGLVSMEVDAWLEGAAPDVLFVPISIDYERLIEARSYARELAGGEKRKESLRGLMSVFGVLFRRYERLYVQFEPPISLRTLARERLGEGPAALAVDDAWAGEAGGGRAAAGDAPERKRRLVQALSSRVAFGIARATTVTPVGLVATALLSAVSRPIRAGELARRIELLRFLAATDGARFASGLVGAPSDPLAPGPIASAVARLERERLLWTGALDGEPAWTVLAERRPLVDFHRNAVIHRYAALAIVAAAVTARGASQAPEAVFERSGWTSRLLKLEFTYQPGRGAEEAFEAWVSALERLGAVERSAGAITAGGDVETLDFLAGMIRPTLEAYGLVLEAATSLLAEPEPQGFPRRRLVAVALELGRDAAARPGGVLPESVSKPTVENAVEWLIMQQILRESEVGDQALTGDTHDLRAVIDRINPLLPAEIREL